MLLEKFQKFSLKNKIIAAIICFTLAILGLVFFIVIPTVRDIRTIGKEIENQRIDLQEKYVKGYSARQLTENLKKIEPKLSLLNQIFISKNREMEFITTIENEANESQVSQKINLSSPQAAENQEFQENSLQLFSSGGFNNLLRYLVNLESLNYYINIKSLELSSSPGSGRTAPIIKSAGQKIPTPEEDNLTKINLSLTASTYWQ